MEINFKELSGLIPALDRIATALEEIAQGPKLDIQDFFTEDTAKPKPEQAKPEPEKPKPSAKKAAKADSQGEELTEQTMRKFAAQAVKKGLKKTPAIIKEITGGETRFADIDPSLYAQIHEAISKALEDL